MDAPNCKLRALKDLIPSEPPHIRSERGKFDRVTYQREYMRRKRAADKAAKEAGK